jgi:hypothetical protein
MAPVLSTSTATPNQGAANAPGVAACAARRANRPATDPLTAPSAMQSCENLSINKIAKKDLLTDLFQRCGGKVSGTNWVIDHSPGLSWSGTHYCAEDANKCVIPII